MTCFLLLAHSSSGTALLLRLVPDKPCRVHLSLLELNVEEGSRNTCGPSTLRPACCEEEVHTERQKNAYPAPSSSSHPSPCERRSLQRIQSITIIKKSLSFVLPAPEVEKSFVQLVSVKSKVQPRDLCDPGDSF